MPQPLSRKIGYVKPAAKKSIPAKKSTEVVKTKPQKPVKQAPAVEEAKKETDALSEKIVSWLNSHPLFKSGGLALQLGLDKNNFYRTMRSERPKISPEIASKIEEVIKNYGYADV
jgi:hypothetical protein